MPIRDHVALLQSVGLIDLSNAELRALKEFNQVIASQTEATLKKTDHLNPTFFKAEQKNPPQIKKDLFKSNWANLSFTLPKSITDLDTKGLLHLAFHTDGEHFYKYLNDVICEEIRKIANSHTISTYKFSDIDALNAYLSTCSMDEIENHLIDCTPSDNPFYQKIAKEFKKIGGTEKELLYTNGKPLDFILSTYIKIFTDTGLKKPSLFDKKETASYFEIKKDLLYIATVNGSYMAASFFTRSLGLLISVCTSIKDADVHYKHFHDKYFSPHIIPCYKTVGHLLLIQLQKQLYKIYTGQPSFHLTADDKHLLKNKILILMYHTLTAAKNLENQSKNIYRLAFYADNYQEYLNQLFPIGCIGNTTTFNTIDELQQFFKDRRPDLISDFDSTNNNHKLYIK